MPSSRRALLDGLHALLQILHVGLERVVARLQLRVGHALLREAAIELPHPHPASLAEPERILERKEEAGEDEGEGFHLI